MGVMCNMTSSSNLSYRTSALGRITRPFLDFTCNYERMSGIFVPCTLPIQFTSENELTCLNNNLLKMHIIVSGNVWNKNTAK